MNEGFTPTDPANHTGNAQRFVIKGQYIRDLSFENPHAPGSLMATNDRPKIDVSVNLRGQKLQDNFYDLTMAISAKAATKDNPLFLVELAYGGIFQFMNIAQEQIEPLLLIDCPFVLFPFARRVIADVTRDGGFPPLMLDPIDFHALYLQNKGSVQKTGTM